MSTNNPEQPKKSSSVLEKLGQKLTTFKDDIQDNIERRKQGYNMASNSQIHFSRSLASEESLVIEKKPPSPQEDRQQMLSTSDDSSLGERSFSMAQLSMSPGKKLTTELSSSCSYHDLFSCETSEQAKEMIINGIRQEHRSTSEESLTKIRPKPSSLLVSPKFRSQITESDRNFTRETLYPISGAVGVISLALTLWKPLSPFLSGLLVGLIFAAGIAYIVIRLYINAKLDEKSQYEWLDFTDLETMFQDKAVKPDRQTTLYTHGEIVFGRYDADRDEEFIRYPVVIRLDNYRLIIQLPIKMKIDEKKEKEIKFIGCREYLIKEANLTLVPEVTLTRVKYWLNEYPIVIQNLQILDKQIVTKQSYEKSRFDTEAFFNNNQTTLSLFFETGPEKENWFHKLSVALRRGKEEIERANRLSANSSESSPSLNSTESSSIHSNLVHLEDRASLKVIETPDTPTTPDKNRLEPFRSQTSETESNSDATQSRSIFSRNRLDSFDKDSSKKKLRKQDDHLQRIFDSPACLDEAAFTLNFLFRRLLCDVFQEKLLEDLLKEKIELKLKEIALTVLEDLHVETIDMGNTLPIILKVEPMQWNSKGLWFNLFMFYRGSFKTSIKTRIVLKRLLSNNAASDQSLTAQFVSKDDDSGDEDELIIKPKSSTREPEVAESIASKRLGVLLARVASNKHIQRIASLKPVSDAIEKFSNAEVGVNIELLNLSGSMTINIPPPPSDRVWIGFSEMPDLNLKVTPVVGESKYSYTLIHAYLEARIRDEIRRLLVFPAMDDQLLSFIHDWVADVWKLKEPMFT